MGHSCAENCPYWARFENWMFFCQLLAFASLKEFVFFSEAMHCTYHNNNDNFLTAGRTRFQLVCIHQFETFKSIWQDARVYFGSGCYNPSCQSCAIFLALSSWNMSILWHFWSLLHWFTSSCLNTLYQINITLFRKDYWYNHNKLSIYVSVFLMLSLVTFCNH